MPSTRRAVLTATAAVVGLAVSGCLTDGASSQASTTAPPSDVDTSRPQTDQPTDTRTPFQGTPVDFPDGPKSQPPIPQPLSAATVREFVRTHEYRFAYNLLWSGPGTDVSLSCEVDSIEDVGVGYRAVVTCNGSSTVRGTVANSTKTRTPVHADWFGQTYVYLVDEETVVRKREGGERRTTTA